MKEKPSISAVFLFVKPKIISPHRQVVYIIDKDFSTPMKLYLLALPMILLFAGCSGGSSDSDKAKACDEMMNITMEIAASDATSNQQRDQMLDERLEELLQKYDIKDENELAEICYKNMPQ